MRELVIRLIEHQSQDYRVAVALRQRILRDPLKLKFSEEELEAEGNQFHVAAFIDGQMVGVLALVPVDKKTLKMRQVAVSEAMQGQGIGTRLVSFSEEFAIKRGFCRIVLHARIAARNFYADLAYSQVGEEFTEIGIPHVSMEKNWCA